MKFLTEFDTYNHYDEARDSLGYPNVSLVDESGLVYCEDEEVHRSLIITAVENNVTVSLNKHGEPQEEAELEYLTAGGEWTDYTIGTGILLQSGQSVSFHTKSTTMKPFNDEANQYAFASTGGINVSGYLMGLIKKDGIGELPAIGSSGSTAFSFIFARLFENGTESSGWQNTVDVRDASRLIFPKNTTSNCYQRMFMNNVNLTAVPTLPAMQIDRLSYLRMFQGCTSLTAAPELPATVLDEQSYAYMFWNCTSLTAAPVLPAPTLKTSSYSHMFEGCTALNSVQSMATDISAENCLNRWMTGVSSTGTFKCPASMVNTYPRSGHGIPAGWTVVPMN